MRQFTDQRVDSTQFAHKARTGQIEQRVAMLVSAIKRAARKSTAADAITLSQYDTLIVSTERVIRQWLVSGEKRKNYEQLKEVISTGIAEAQLEVSDIDVESLKKSIEEELAQLEKARFQIN